MMSSHTCYGSCKCSCTSVTDDVSSVGVLEPVTCEPDTNEPVDADGVFVTYRKLADLVSRANSTIVTHCQGCNCSV